MDSTGRMLNRVPPSVISWGWPIARITLCIIVCIEFSKIYSVISSEPVLRGFLLSWIGWTAMNALLTITVQPLQPKLLRAIVVGDTVLVLAAIAVLHGAEVAIIAFAICVGVVAMKIRLSGKWVFGAIAAGIITFLLRDAILLVSGVRVPTNADMSEISEILQGILILLGLFMLIIWTHRRHQLDEFSSNVSSLRALSLERSFEFDLQAWANASAALFVPQKAACVLNAPAQNAANQYYHCNLPIWQRDQDREELVDTLRNMPVGYSLFDIEYNRIISPDTGLCRPFNENENRIARLLHRADIKAALVQPMQIDRGRGGFICAVDSPIDAIIMAEALFIGQHVTEMNAYLGKVSRAQRNFIADAHDVARRDLHDGVLQSLAALRMRLLLLTKHRDVAEKPVELELRKAVDIVTLEQFRLRGFLENSETADHTVNLVSQMDICVRTISLQWGIDVKLNSEEPAIPVDTESSFNIEHLLREVITNAVRHAKSRSLTVSLSLKQNALMMAVTDLSQSLEGEQVFKKSALTMKSASLRDRLRIVNGEAYAEGLGKGTLLSIRIPMQQVDND